MDRHAGYVDDPNTPDTGHGGAPLADMGAYEYPDLATPPIGDPRAGDANCDGVVNFDDIDPFTLALSDPALYEQLYPTRFVLAADANHDGSVDFDDITPFVALLSAGVVCPWSDISRRTDNHATHRARQVFRPQADLPGGLFIRPRARPRDVPPQRVNSIDITSQAR